MKKKYIIALYLSLSLTTAFTQPLFSIATDVGIQRNFKPEQKYWAFGHTTQALFHITAKDGIYITFTYYSPGNYKNQITATANAPSTVPQQINLVNKGKMRLKEFSTGWRKYIKGKPDAEKGWNLYGFAGLGIILGRVDNTYSTSIDTSSYAVPVKSGRGNFKRLTLDLGAGFEIPLVGDFYFYSEAKVWIPTTDYPSKYIFVNDNAPFTGMIGAGIRLLF